MTTPDGRYCPDCGRSWSVHTISLNEWASPAYRCEPYDPPAAWHHWLFLAGLFASLTLFWGAVIFGIYSALT